MFAENIALRNSQSSERCLRYNAQFCIWVVRESLFA